MMKKKSKISLYKAYDIIKRPVTTEKSTNLQQFNQYSFIVLNFLFGIDMCTISSFPQTGPGVGVTANSICTFITQPPLVI